MRIEILADVKTTLGEGPLWDVEEQRLYWIDSFDGRSSAAPWTGARSGPGTCRRRSARWPYAAAAGRSSRSSAASTPSISTPARVALIHDPEPDRPANRLNDGKVDRQGRFVAGSMDTMEEGANGALYRLDPDLSVHRLDSGIICSKGPYWSPDGRILYFNDTWSGEIWAYDYDTATGNVSNRRTFAPVDMSGGGAAGRRLDGRCRGLPVERAGL